MRCSIKSEVTNRCMIGNSPYHRSFSSRRSSSPRDKPVGGHKDTVARSQDNINKFKIANKGRVLNGKISRKAS